MAVPGAVLGSTRCRRPQTKEPRRKTSVRRLHARAAGGRSSLRPPDPPLESKDAPLHLHGAGRHLHHRPAADPRLDRAGCGLRAQRVRARRLDPVRGHQEAMPGLDRRGGCARRHAVREPPLARRPAHQLADHLGAHCAPARAAAPPRRGPARASALEGAHLDDERAREARRQPGRRRRHEVRARRGLRRRPPQGAAGRARSAAPRACRSSRSSTRTATRTTPTTSSRGTTTPSAPAA